MKKQYVNSVSILLTMLCLAFTACNGMFTGGDTGTVRVVIGGGTARSVGGKGLPALNEKNTVITITDEEGTALARETTSVTVTLPIGTKITVKAVVTTAAGEWHGSEKHTVTAGDNFIAVKLSKTLKVAANLLFSITGKDSSGSNIVSLSTQNGTKLLDGILIGTKPVTARDKIGRIYVRYEDTSSTDHLKRFDVEGNEDIGFEAAFAAALPSSVTISDIDNIAIDSDDNYIFLFKGNTVYCFKEKEDHSFESFSSAAFPSALASSASAVAVDDDVLFAVYGQTLFAGEFEFTNSPIPGNKILQFKSTTTRKPLAKLRTDSVFSNNLTECTGLFADKSGVYCLLKEQELHYGNLYALGQIVRYQYSGSAFTGETKIGLNPKAAGTDGIPFDARYFSNPVGFIGYDEENLYIADDGFGIQYKNENWHIMNNRNRIAAFNRKTGSLSFSDSGATWYEQKPEYKLPNTKILLWGKFYGSIKYWTSADGTEAFSPSNKLFEAASGKNPTDIFCYDQDGNLYILWKESFGYNVRRFALKEDGSYDTQSVDLNNSLGSHPISAIAVDISGGQNYLYYTYKDGPNTHIQRYSWNSTSFSTATQDSTYGVHINSILNKIFFTALAANKDGVFVGVKETYQDSGIDKYRLKVQKYAKTGSLTAPDSEITLVDNAVSYTDVADPPNPIPDPNSGSSPNSPCNQYQETINGLQIANGMLYGISSKLHRKWLLNVAHMYSPDVFKHSSILYTIGTTAETLPNRPLATKEKPVDDTNKVGYGFYRFIAVKYDEAERIRLIIASDSAWGKNGSGHSLPADGNNTDNIVEFNLKDMLFGEVKQSENVFSKTFNDSGFTWE